MDRRFYIAMLIFAAILILVWTTIGPGVIDIQGRKIDVRWIPTVVVGLFAFRSWLHLQRKRLEEADVADGGR